MGELTQEISDRDAAEDYRRQRQLAEARKSGFIPMREDEVELWLSEHEELIRKIALANSLSGSDVDGVVKDYRLALKGAPPGSPFDDVNARVIVARILADIERFCGENNIPMRGGIVAGVQPAYGNIIHQANVPWTDVSIIATTIPFLAFCNLVARAMARSLPHRIAENGSPSVSFDPGEVRHYLNSQSDIVYEWSRVLAHYAMFGWPPQQTLSTTPQGLQQVTRIQLLRALELFAVSHEVGHHVCEHGAMESSEDRADMLAQEHEADIFARLISIGIGAEDEPQNYFAIAGVGGVVLLGSLELVRRAKAVLGSYEDSSDASHAATHPPFAERIAAIAILDEKLPGNLETSAPAMRAHFLGILEVIWELTLPEITRIRDAGMRPKTMAESGADWLPV